MKVKKFFVRTLEGIYHARPAYLPAAVGGGKPPAPEVVRTPLALAKPGQVRRAEKLLPVLVDTSRGGRGAKALAPLARAEARLLGRAGMLGG